MGVSYVSKVTLQTHSPQNEENQVAIDYLKEFAITFGSAIRTSFCLRNRQGKTKRRSKTLRTSIATEVEKRYGLSNSEAKNASLKGIAAYDSQAALSDIYIEEANERIKATYQGIGKNYGLIKKAQKINDYFEIRRLKKSNHYKVNRITKNEAQIKRLKQSKESGRFRVCFGSKRLAIKQHNLGENGYSNHAQWLADWQLARSNQVFYEGSNNYSTGNQLVRYNPEAHSLTITVSPQWREKYGEVVTLHNIEFKYGANWLKAAIEPIKKESTRKGKNGNKAKATRWGSKQPVTYNFIFKGKKLYINATIDHPGASITSSLKLGALGIDFNPTSIDWVVIDREGNLRKHGAIKINVQDKRSNQTKDIIGKAVAQIVRIAESFQVPVVIEDLDFQQKKASLKEKGKKYARMLSNMAYSRFTQMIETRCGITGVELIFVEPAYTSVIGVTKYMALYGLNSGCAAALVIARRGQGRTEKLPKRHARYFRKPEDIQKSRAWQTFARIVKLCGQGNRHTWYSSGTKQVRSNSPLHGKLRQTCRSKRQTVQILNTPHIRQKTCANGSLGIST
jgi:IS605 OrfB family transposase